MSHPGRTGHDLVLRRVHAAIAGDESWRLAEEPLVMGEGGGELSLFAGLVREHREAGDDPALNLVDDDQAPNSTAAPPLWRGMMRVCGSNRLTSFSVAGTDSPANTRRSVWWITCSTRGTYRAI